jgi:hypothetical protein
MTILLGLRTLALIAFVGAASAILLGSGPGAGLDTSPGARALHAMVAVHN